MEDICSILQSCAVPFGTNRKNLEAKLEWRVDCLLLGRETVTFNKPTDLSLGDIHFDSRCLHKIRVPCQDITEWP